MIFSALLVSFTIYGNRFSFNIIISEVVIMNTHNVNYIHTFVFLSMELCGLCMILLSVN